MAKDRIAYDGRSYGAAQGALLAGIEKRIKAHVPEVVAVEAI